MINKMRLTITKLNNINIIPQLTYIVYNAYMIKSIYFGCSIMKLINQQDAILMKIYKLMLLWKLRLSMKFPRIILYTRKTVIGIGIMKPSTVIDTLVLKLYVGYKRQKSRIAMLIKANEEIQFTQNRFTTHSILISENERFWTNTWSDQIVQIIEQQQLKLMNIEEVGEQVTSNKILMKFAVQYCKIKSLHKKDLVAINQVRLFK